MFREVTPDVFANNRTSSTMVKRGKNMAEIQAKQVRSIISDAPRSDVFDIY